MLGFDGEYPAGQRKAKFWRFSQKIGSKTFHRKTYFA